MASVSTKTMDLFWERHAVTLMAPKHASGARRWKCKYCGKVSTSSSTRFIKHVTSIKGGGIAICSLAPPEVIMDVNATFPGLIAKYKAEHNDVIEEEDPSLLEVASTPSTPFVTPTASPSASASASGCASGSGTATSTLKRKPTPPPTSFKSSKQPTLFECQNTVSALRERQRLAEIEIARAVIECNLSFNVLQTPQWKRMIKAVANVGPCEGWTGVGYKDMRTKKLQEEKERIDKAIAPIQNGWSKYGCSILSDGWSDKKKRGIMNILVASPLGTYFLRAVDTGKEGKKTSAEFIYTHIRQAIVEVGPSNVVQVVTDNASNCRKMGRLVEEEFPSIVWTPCASHCLDLLMEDIGKFPWVKEVLRDSNSIVTFFTRKLKALAIYRAHAKLELKKPATTRFASMWLLLERLYDVHMDLQRTVVSNAWREWDEHDTIEGNAVQRQCLNNDYWRRVKVIVIAITPLYRVLRMTDMEGATIGLLTHFMREARVEISSCTYLDESE